MKLSIAEVRSIDDPSQSGHCQIRIYNQQNDEQGIKDDDLKWAAPLHPITSAATGGAGVLPSGPVVGTRVLISYLEDDTSEQYPIILGTLPRAQLPSKQGVRKQSDEDSGGKIDTSKAAPDSPLPHPDYKGMA